MGNSKSKSSSDYRYKAPGPAYSRHMGGQMGSYSYRSGRDIGHPTSVFIGRQRLAQHYSENVRIRVKEITSPILGRELIKRCGNEGHHPYLDEQGKTTLKFLRASISFIPEVIEVGGDLCNASFIFSQPGREFVITSGNGDWEFYFSQGYGDEIYGRCVRKPTLRYIWDNVTSTVRRIGSFLLPIVGPQLLALM